MASSRPRRDVRVSSPSHSDVEDAGSDSDYSPGSLIIDTGTDEVVSSAQSSSPVVHHPSPSSPSSANKGKRSVARRQYNTESNRMVFTGVRLLGQISVMQTGHSQPVDRLDLYAFGWGDFHLDIVTRHSHSFIPVRNIYEKVIPGLKRNVLSARISKLQVKSEALTEPYISSMKKLGLVVTGASHFVGITDFVKICRYFHVEPPGILTKFCSVTSEIDPETVLRLFSTDQTTNQTPGSLVGDDAVSKMMGSTLNQSSGIASLLGGGGGGMGEGERPSSRGSAMSGGDISASPHNVSEEVDIRRLTLAGGGRLTVVVRSGKPHLLKVELSAILPSHTRDVLETIRRTYGITVLHANKAEIGLLKNKGVVGGKAGRCALFSASDVCRMFHHWKTSPPPALTQLAKGELPSERLENVTDTTFPPSYPLTSYGFPLEDLPTFPDVSTALPPSSSTAFTPSHPPTNLPPFSTLPNTHHQPPSSHMAPRLSHPPSITSSPFPISSLSADTFQQPIQMLNSLQSTPPSLPPPPQFPPPSQPPFSATHYPLSTQSLPPYSTPSHPPYPPHLPQSNFSSDVVGIPPPITTNYAVTGLNPVAGDAAGKPPVVSGVDYSRTPIKTEGGGGGSGGRRRSLSTTGPPLDDQDLDYVSMVWGENQLTLVCPPGGAEPFLAIPELVDKIFHNRAHVSAQRRNELGITTVPATSLQMHILRAKGSLDAFTGNAKLVSLSGAVKLAAVSNIQIPGTVIQMIRKYCKEPLESIITPAGFAPATHAPSSVPSSLPSSSSQSSYYSPSSLSSQSSHPHSSHSEPLSQDSGSSYPTGVTSGVKKEGGNKVVTKQNKGATPSKQGGTSSNDDSAASVSPHDGVPQHPDLIDPGSSFTNTVDGTYCLVKWGAHRLALLIGSQRVHYMGLYQIFQTLFKQYVTRMNFKMRMRKLEIKSIRAASSVRQALINLDALPQSSPVCGLIRVSEVERLARSYGIEPPQVLYDVFLLRHSDQKQLPNYTRSSGAKTQQQSESSGKGSVSTTGAAAGDLGQFGQGSQEAWGATQMLMREQAALMQSLPFTSRMGSGGSNFSSSQTSSLPTATQSMVITTAAGDKDALMVSVPRQALTSRFRLVSRPVAPPGLMTGFHSSRSTYPPLASRGSMLHSLARKISQKSRKLGKGKTSGVSAVRSCPKCQFVNPASKKRCAGCDEYIVGRHCPSCGTLNHNRTRECFKCNAVIEDGEGVRYRTGTSEDSLSPESPLSPHFSPPPLRNAALKSMFPQDSGKAEDSGVVTKTMFSGNLASSRKCLECGQLNSKMAKKCLQCKSPLQGRPCPQCNRPNHSHSTECYKCGHSLPSTATKWVYIGSNSNKIYRSQDSNSSSRISAGLKNRATRICLRCDRLRNSGQFTCGRCGDMYWTKPVVGGANDIMDTPTIGGGSQGHSSKKRKAGLEPNWSNIPSEPDVDEMVSFASNLLCLGIGEGLLSLVNEAESKARETVHQAEEELEGMEEEYQACARRREEKEGVLNDARAELDTLIADVEHSSNRLSELQREEDNARTITGSHPATISQLREKIECALRILSSSPSVTTTTNTGSSTAAVASSSSVAVASLESLSALVPPDVVEKMDTSDQ